MLRLVVYALCFASGLAGLTYEVIWLRLLAVQLGNAAFATAAVLAAMMAGMGAGAAWIGKEADRRDPLALYGGLEIALGAVALAVPSAVQWLGEAIVPLLRAAGPGGLGVALRFTAATSILFVPAALMGATVPVLVRFVQLRGAAVGTGTGSIYALNTAGAAVGCALAGFVLLGRFGISATGAAAAGLDVAVGLTALALARFASRAKPDADSWRAGWAGSAAADEPDRSARGSWWPLGIAFAAGFVLLALEGLWTRLLTIAAGHDVHAFASMLAATLLAMAAGALLFRSLPPPARGSRRLVPALLTASGIGALGSVALCGALYLARGVDILGLGGALPLARSHELSMAQHAAFAALLVAPAGAASGALLPALCARFGHGAAGGRVGRVLAANTLGSIAGAFVGPLALVPILGIAPSFVAVASLPVALAAALSLRSRSWRFASAAVAALALAAALVPPSLPRRMLAHKIGPAHLRFALYEEGATATVAVVENDIHPERTLYLNGINEVTTRLVHDESFSLLGHLGALLHPEPRQVLVVCLGGGLSAGAVARHPDIERVTIVDLEPSVALATRRFEDLNYRVLDDPRVELVIDDGRNHLRTTDRRYDVMVVDSTHPRAVDSWLLYTREMYATARARLSAEGWMVQWVPLHGLSVDEMRIITRTFLQEFPTGSLWVNAGFEPYGRSGYALLVGQRGAGRFDPEVIERRLLQPRVRADLRRWGLSSVQEVLECFVAGPERLRRWTEGAPINTDDLPLTQFVTRHSEAAPMDVGRMLEVLEPVAGQLSSTADPALAASLRRRLDARELLLAGHLQRAAQVCGPGCAKYAGYRRALSRGRRQYLALASRYPDDAARLVEVGASLSEIGHGADGVRVLERASEVAPDDPRVWLNLGVARAGRGVFDGDSHGDSHGDSVGDSDGDSVGDEAGAEAAFRRALALEPDLVLAQVGLALSLDRQGRGSEAVAVLFRALASQPELAQVHAALGHVLMRRPGERRRAERHLRRALAIDPRQLHASVSLGRLLLASDRARDAVTALARAQRYHPTSTDLLYTLGVACARAGETASAREAFERALHVDPADGQARAALRELAEAQERPAARQALGGG